MSLKLSQIGKNTLTYTASKSLLGKKIESTGAIQWKKAVG